MMENCIEEIKLKWYEKLYRNWNWNDYNYCIKTDTQMIDVELYTNSNWNDIKYWNITAGLQGHVTIMWWTEVVSDWSVFWHSAKYCWPGNWRMVSSCVKAKGKHFENMLWCAVPQLSIICYETYIQLFFVSQLLTSHDF